MNMIANFNANISDSKKMNLNISSWSPEELSKSVMEILKREFGFLPSAGFCAGQAVASALYEITQCGLKGQYNDLDIFLPSHWEIEAKNTGISDLSDSEIEFSLKVRKSREVFKETIESRIMRFNIMKAGKGMIADEEISVVHGSFGDRVVTGAVQKNAYSIQDSIIDSAHSYINYIAVGYTGKAEKFNQCIINGFDLNAVCAGIDLNTGEVIINDSFQNFLFSRELKVNFFGTPSHTAVRLLKKKDQITGSRLNVEAELHKLQTIRAIIKAIEIKFERFIPGNRFSDIYKARYDQYSDVLNNYFELRAVTVLGYDYALDKKIIELDTIFKNGEISSETYYKKKRDLSESIHRKSHRLYELHAKSFCEETVRNTILLTDVIFNNNRSVNNTANSTASQSTFFYERGIEPFIEIFENLYEIFYFDWKESLIKRNELSVIKQIIDADKDKNKVNKLLGMDLIFQIISKPSFTIRGYTMPVIRRVLVCAEKHDTAFYRLKGLEFSAYLKMNKLINHLEKTGKFAEIGIAESNTKVCRSINEKSIEEVTSELTKILMEENSDERVEPIFTTITMTGKTGTKYDFHDVCSAIDLINLGASQRHCVGGYWNRVKKRSTIIVRMTKEGESLTRTNTSTLEISIQYNKSTNKKKFVKVQHRSFCNKSVCDEREELANDFMEMLNDNIDHYFDVIQNTSGKSCYNEEEIDLIPF